MHKASRFQAIHQFDGAVMADLHALGELPNPRSDPGWDALDRQHQLILSALQSGFLYRLLAEMKESPNLVAELRQRLVIQ